MYSSVIQVRYTALDFKRLRVGGKKSESIVKSLKKFGISNALDGSEDDILYE